jgi:hypothetical protein
MRLMFHRAIARTEADTGAESARLDRLFASYRKACPDQDAGADFMPGLWAKIEAREQTTHAFSRIAKALVTAALAATAILGMMVSTASQANPGFNGTYLEALMSDHASSLEPLNPDRISEMEQQ